MDDPLTVPSQGKALPAVFNKPRDLLKAARPKQWTKNLIIFCPVIFSAKLSEPKPVIATIICALAFCLVSSAIYLFNDVLDREKDKVHPRKCQRPIASGRVSVSTALVTAAVLVSIGFALTFLITPSVALFVLAYVVLMLIYSTSLKHIVLLDVMTVATGFVLRAVAGAVAAGVPPSGWFLLCTSFGALFIALEKRRHELTTLANSAQSHRAVLDSYSAALIDKVESIIVPSLLICYIFYSFLSWHGQWMLLSVPFVFYGIVRYQVLSMEEALTGQPEEVLWRDRPMQATIFLWLLTCLGVLYQVIPNIAHDLHRWLDSLALVTTLLPKY